MDGNILLADIQSAIATNAQLLIWCSSNDMTEPTVLVGIDTENYPTEDDYPLVVISRVNKKGGVAAELEEFVFVIGCGIFNDSPTVRSGNLLTFEQLYDLENYRQLVVRALGGVDLRGGYIAEIEVEDQPIEAFPFFATNMEVKIVRPYEFREDWLL